MNLLKASLFVFVLAPCVACAEKKPSSPPDIAFNIDFPSVAAAVFTQSINVYVFSGTSTPCLSLLQDELNMNLTQSNTPVDEIDGLTPCELVGSSPSVNTAKLELGASYTMLAAGFNGQNTTPVFVGCAIQDNFGTTLPLDIPMTYVPKNMTDIATTTCSSLTDFCSNSCM